MSAPLHAARFLVLGAGLALLGCGEPNRPPSVESVAVSPPSATLVSIGESVQLTASPLDSKGTAIAGKTVVWTTSDESVATVSTTGVVTAVANGTCTIRATSDGVAGVASLTVSQAAATVEVSPQSVTLASLGETVQLTAIVRDANNHAVAGATVAWSSLQETTASVGTTGLATARSNGTATVRATAATAVGTSEVTVRQRPAEIAFDAQPRYAGTRMVFAPVIAVIRDALGSRVEGAASDVSLAIGANPGGAALLGTTTVNAVDGIARFDNLSIDRPGVGYTLVASTGGLMRTTNAFNVAALLYVANIDPNTVTVVETGTNVAVATVNVGAAPVSVAVTPDGRFAYVANRDHGTLSVISTATATRVGTIDVGGRLLQEVEITPDGAHAYVASQVIPGFVSVVSTASRTMLGTIAVGDIPVHLAITPDGRFVYVVNRGLGSESVSVIETAGNTVAATIPLGFAPNDVAITPDGATAYVTIPEGLVVINTATNTIVDTIPLAGYPETLGITPDGALAYVGIGTLGHFAVVDLKAGAQLALLNMGTSFGAPVFTRDGQFLYVSSSRPDHVAMIARATNAVVRKIAVGATPGRIAITPF
jgi:YVTN family beta-propeller protein